MFFVQSFCFDWSCFFVYKDVSIFFSLPLSHLPTLFVLFLHISRRCFGFVETISIVLLFSCAFVSVDRLFKPHFDSSSKLIFSHNSFIQFKCLLEVLVENSRKNKKKTQWKPSHCLSTHFLHIDPIIHCDYIIITVLSAI